MDGMKGLLLITGLLGLIFMILSADVTLRRRHTGVMTGDGDGVPGTEVLRNSVRAHANFAEYVPLILLLLAGDRFAGAPAAWVDLPAALLVLGRIAHPFGMHRRPPNLLRASGVLLTWAVLVIASLEAIYLAI